jgi:hypothetical protein
MLLALASSAKALATLINFLSLQNLMHFWLQINH